MKKMLLAVCIASAATMSYASVAQAAEYRVSEVIQEPRVANKHQIEVEVVFSYDCPICYRLLPEPSKLSSAFGSDVKVINVPAPLNKKWAVYSRAYYVAQELGILDKAHKALYEEVIGSKGRSIVDANSLAVFFNYYFDIPRADTLRVYQSKKIERALAEDYMRLSAYQLTAAPAVIVNGEFVVTGITAGNSNEILRQAQTVVNKIRAEKGMLDNGKIFTPPVYPSLERMAANKRAEAEQLADNPKPQPISYPSLESLDEARAKAAEAKKAEDEKIRAQVIESGKAAEAIRSATPYAARPVKTYGTVESGVATEYSSHAAAMKAKARREAALKRGNPSSAPRPSAPPSSW